MTLRRWSRQTKNRYALKEENSEQYILANQGHSIKEVTDLELTPITSSDDIPEGIAVHGTTKEAWQIIKTNGLSRMNRNHIHFAVGAKGSKNVISGMRNSSQVQIYLDIDQVLADGIPLFRSANNVILSPGVGDQGVIQTKYFKWVVDSHSKPFDPMFPTALPQQQAPRTIPGSTLAQQQTPKTT